MKFQFKNIFFYSIIILTLSLILLLIFNCFKQKENTIKIDTISVIKKWGSKKHTESDVSVTLESKMIKEDVFFKAKIILNDKKDNDFSNIVITFFDADGFIIYTSKMGSDDESFIDSQLQNNQIVGTLSWNNKIDKELYNKIKYFDFILK
jgi:hypothetical protein